jgi:hypothetical protein
MNRRALVVCLVTALTVLAFSGFVLAAGNDAKAGAAGGAADLNAKVEAAKNLLKEAQALTDEAVRGKAVDKSQPVAAGEKPKLKDLTDEERKARFQEADKKYDEAAKKMTDLIAAQKKTPGVIADQTPLKTQIDVSHSSELVKNVHFLRQHKIGTAQEWLTSAQKAVTLDKTNADAQQLVTDLKAVIAAEKKPAPTTTKK